MKKVKFYFTIFLFLTIACNKDGNTSSPNTIKYFINGLSLTICPDTINAGQMIGGPTCKLFISRKNRNIGVLPSSISISLDSNCDFTSGPIPYTTQKFICMIQDNGNDSTYHPEADYGYTGRDLSDPTNSKGLLTLQLNYRKGGHIKGTIDGQIYGGPVGNPGLAYLGCEFDVIVPVR